MNPRFAVIDIDGCVVDCSARLPLIKTDIEAFHEAWESDTAIDQGVWLVTSLWFSGAKIIFNTSRSEEHRDRTLATLHKVLPNHLHGKFALLMREAGLPHNTATQPAEKISALEGLGITPDQVFLAVDDRLAICEAYREWGVVAWQLGPDWN
jgi:hypothetical protein